MTGRRAFVGLGSNEGDAHAHIATALAALDRDEVRVAAAGRLVWSPYLGAPAGVRAARVLNTVAEVRTHLTPNALLERLQAIEAAAGRVRDGRVARTLDLDLLSYADVVLSEASLTLPHPRCLERGFVLVPWLEVAPLYEIPGTGATVLEHAAALLRDDPVQETSLQPAVAAPLADREAPCVVLTDRQALDTWRAAQEGTVGVVMTMGALHAGHAALVQRAAAECDTALATVFVNPTQFAPGEDLVDYPRSFAADLQHLRHHGAAAVYAPTPLDMYPEGLTTTWEPSGAALGFEGAQRPGHFAGVVTVVKELWARTRADVSYFGRKDAQQLAVLRQARAEAGLAVEIVGCPTVRAPDQMALSSRNRYLSDQERLIARELAAVLQAIWAMGALGCEVDGARVPFDPTRDLPLCREHLRSRGLAVDYLELVDPDTMAVLDKLTRPCLALAAVRLGSVRLLDNRWLAPPWGGAA